MRRGSLTQKQLERALEEQARRSGQRLGDLLVELKLCDREEIEAAVEEQELHRMPSPSNEVVTAQETLRAAFAKVHHETRRLTERRTQSGITGLKFSPED
jgi:hypothetical protein